MTMREKIARALAAHACRIADKSGADLPADIWEQGLPQADAALNAMREPDEAMIEAGDEITSHACNYDTVDAADVWAAMIDAASHP